MYSCRKAEPGKWAVGSPDAQGRWVAESSWNSAAEATEHLHALNEKDAEERASDAGKFMKPDG
jgi:hypothetical protein